MRGAFVVRLGPQTDSERRQFEGSVEEVDTGNRLKFRSTEELLTFLGQSFEEALHREQELNQPKSNKRMDEHAIAHPGFKQSLTTYKRRLKERDGS